MRSVVPRRRWASLAATLTVAAAMAGTSCSPDARPDSAPAPAPETAVVETGDVVAAERLRATLGFGEAFVVVAPRGGRLTAHPPPGRVVGFGDVLYEVDGSGVELLQGARPFWRTLEAGVDPGPDVRQLEESLAALGADAGGALTIDDTFTAATTEALKQWQASRGRPPTGVLDPTGAAAQPEPIRVASVHVPLGAAVAPGLPLLTATRARNTVTVDLDRGHAGLMRPGLDVGVVLPDGASVAGRVERVAPVPRASGEGGSPSPPAWVATVVADVPDHLALDGVAVTVVVERVRASSVLVVPVAALLARPEGGYAVEPVPSRDGRATVPVEVGAVAGGRAEVRGDLAAGDRVVVAPT